MKAPEKAFRLLPFILLAATGIFYSCASLPLRSPQSQAWASGGLSTIEQSFQCMSLSEPVVDRQTQSYSIKAEINRMAPLLFLDRGIRLLPSGAAAEYQVDIHASEREYEVGLKTRRSTVVDIWVCKRDGSAPFILSSTPLLASRSQSSGNLASSQELYRLLDAAIREIANKAIKLKKEEASTHDV